MYQKLAQALNNRNIADAELAAELKLTCPIKAFVYWKWSGRMYEGTVILHSYGDRIKVQNALTGKKRWIRAYNLLNRGINYEKLK